MQIPPAWNVALEVEPRGPRPLVGVEPLAQAGEHRRGAIERGAHTSTRPAVRLVVDPVVTIGRS